ncbi:MAG: hypothetical protein Q8O14_15145 [bacterium]|nr:hypothetical protein [bacterium]
MWLDDAVRWDPTGLVEYLRIALGLEAAGYAQANDLLRNHPHEIGRCLLEVGERELESCSRVGNLLVEGTWTADAHLVVEGLRHPLVDSCQPLSLSSRAQVVIIMGDNMSGKSTLLRALGLDILLRQSLGHGCSQSLGLPTARMESVIAKTDNRAAGESLFFRELCATREALDRLALEGGWLLLDEPFSGTRRAIRHALTRAVLEVSAHRRIRFLIVTHDDGLEVAGAERFHLVVDPPEAGGGRHLRQVAPPTWDTENLLRRAGMPESVVERFRLHLSAQDPCT